MSVVDIKPADSTISAERNLRNSGGSVVISFPPEILDAMDWDATDTMNVVANWDNNEVTISKK